MSHDTNRVKNKILNDEDRLSKEPDLSLKKSVRSNSLILNGLRSHFFKFSALTSLASIILLSGCSSAGPHLVNGEYYYGGDSECVSYRQTATQRSNGEISCYNSSGQYTGTRTALSLEEVQQYQQQQISIGDAINAFAQGVNQNRPVYTNCYRFGNQVQCTSY